MSADGQSPNNRKSHLSLARESVVSFSRPNGIDANELDAVADDDRRLTHAIIRQCGLYGSAEVKLFSIVKGQALGVSDVNDAGTVVDLVGSH